MLRHSVPRSKRQYVHNLNSPALRLARSLPGAREALFPDFIEPSLPTLTDQPPSGDNWLHEVKHDGYRFQAHVHNGVRFFTRRGYDWGGRLSYLVTALAPIASRAVILDGEIIVQTAEGRSDFHALEKALKAPNGSENLTYLVFDILYLDGFDLRPSSLVDRKRVLKELLTSINGPIKFSEYIEGDGPVLWRRACELELEGIVSKQRDDRYRSGRSNTWVKTTCRHRDTFTIAGWAVKNGRFDGIYLAHPHEDELVYAGKLDRGFSEEDKISLLERLKPLQIRKRPMRAARRKFPKARWIKPEVLVDAEFRGKTGDGLLRHASFKGVREDLMDKDKHRRQLPRRAARDTTTGRGRPMGRPGGKKADRLCSGGTSSGFMSQTRLSFIGRRPRSASKGGAEIDAEIEHLRDRDITRAGQIKSEQRLPLRRS